MTSVDAGQVWAHKQSPGVYLTLEKQRDGSWLCVVLVASNMWHERSAEKVLNNELWLESICERIA